ncbi:MAG: DUF6978 family protein [Athalassotoga sp.]
MKNDYNQTFINELIKIQKKILDPPKKEMILERAYYRNEFKIESQDGKYQFNVFLRQNADFIENFSIGLVYLPFDDDSITLCRFNGPHGGREDSLTHWVSHIHIAKKENIEKGLKPEKYAEKTDLYSTFPEAIVAFMRYCNIIGWKEYFQGYSQIPMDFK